MKKDCFARNVLQKSSGFLTSINTFVIKKQGIHTEWGVFDEMESMLLIYDAFQKGCKFLQAQKCCAGLLCRGEVGVLAKRILAPGIWYFARHLEYSF